MEKLFSLLNAIAPLSAKLTELLQTAVQSSQFLKGDYILREGQVCKHIYFLESGLVRILNKLAEKEVTSWFLKEKDVFISVSSFFKQQPSYENIVALEDCLCWGIHYQQLQELCLICPEFNTHRIAITESYYCQSEDRHYKMLIQTPEERYANLIENESEWVHRIALNLLPSYLDVSTSAFFKIRNDYYYIKRKRI